MPQIIYNIAANNIEEFILGYLAARPIPINPTTKEPIMTAEQWIKECGKKYFIFTYRKGKAILAKKQTECQEGLIE